MKDISSAARMLGSVFEHTQLPLHANGIDPAILLQSIRDGIVSIPPKLAASEGGSHVLCQMLAHLERLGVDDIAQERPTHLQDTLDLVRALLDAGVDPLATDYEGRTPLGAALAAQWPDATHEMLDRCQDRINANTPDMDAWIGDAAKTGDGRLVSRLIDLGGNPGALDANGNTALHLATSVEVVDALLKSGASVKAINHSGESIETVWLNTLEDTRETKEMVKRLHLFAAPGQNKKARIFGLVADQRMGIRKGSALMKDAGIENPKQATDAQGMSMFFHQVARLLDHSFACAGEAPTMASATTKQENILTAIRWADAKHMTCLDQGAFHLMRFAARGSQFERDGVFLEAGKQMGLALEDITAEAHLLAIDALDAMVRGKMLGNGSEIAGMALAGSISLEDGRTWLGDANDRSILAEWLDRTYKGSFDTIWLDPARTARRYIRPDTPLPTLGNLPLPGQGNAFWRHGDCGYLVLRAIHRDLFAANDRALYFGNAPKAGGPTKARKSEQWLNHLGEENLVATLNHPHAKVFISHIMEHVPGLATQFEHRALSTSTPQAKGAQKTHRL